MRKIVTCLVVIVACACQTGCCAFDSKFGSGRDGIVTLSQEHVREQCISLFARTAVFDQLSSETLEVLNVSGFESGDEVVVLAVETSSEGLKYIYTNRFIASVNSDAKTIVLEDGILQSEQLEVLGLYRMPHFDELILEANVVISPRDWDARESLEFNILPMRIKNGLTLADGAQINLAGAGLEGGRPGGFSETKTSAEDGASGSVPGLGGGGAESGVPTNGEPTDFGLGGGGGAGAYDGMAATASGGYPDDGKAGTAGIAASQDVDTPGFNILIVGGGGGGGAADLREEKHGPYTNKDWADGGGGGDGGGVIIIYAATISHSDQPFAFANGLDGLPGGTPHTPDGTPPQGGGGGGGGGGMIYIVSCSELAPSMFEAGGGVGGLASGIESDEANTSSSRGADGGAGLLLMP